MSRTRNRKTRRVNASSRPRKRVRRNVKKQREGFIFPTPLATILSLAVVLSLAYLWLCGRNEALAAEIRKAEVELEKARKEVVNEEYKWSRITTPQRLLAQIRKFDIDIDWPTNEQVVQAGALAPWHEDGPEPTGRQLMMAEADDLRP